jgi:hypothetical protein
VFGFLVVTPVTLGRTGTRPSNKYRRDTLHNLYYSRVPLPESHL